jgi:hypothetical protein
MLATGSSLQKGCARMSDESSGPSWPVPGHRVKEKAPARGAKRTSAGQVLFVGGSGYSPDDVRLQTDTGRVVLRKIYELEEEP